MYFWDIQSLKKELAANQVSEHESFQYFMAHMVVISLLFIPFTSYNIYDIASSILSVPILVFGLLYVHKQSSGGQFLTQYFALALAWVFGIRFLVAFLPFIFIFSAVSPVETSMWDVVFFSVFEIVFYWRLGIHFREIKGFPPSLVES
ncbi:hypothetical protein [Photobacterium atrarenae]|uniref:Uncharacterized protein n=1 Tax=Photobacterium atrarenae TaxID=865757 RepID=A0ABY5GIR5_9GAMM|nr:hypothetical protein [Photobacterium atrarenae]UTV29180.1 hypothetical protein NNL38_08155 [Photobacterium atrarenae]